MYTPPINKLTFDPFLTILMSVSYFFFIFPFSPFLIHLLLINQLENATRPDKATKLYKANPKNLYVDIYSDLNLTNIY